MTTSINHIFILVVLCYGHTDYTHWSFKPPVLLYPHNLHSLVFLFLFPPQSFLPPCIQRLLSEVEVSVSVEDKAVGRYSVSISPLCPEGSTAKDRSCSGVQPNQTVNTQASPHKMTTRLTTGGEVVGFYGI